MLSWKQYPHPGQPTVGKCLTLESNIDIILPYYRVYQGFSFNPCERSEIVIFGSHISEKYFFRICRNPYYINCNKKYWNFFSSTHFQLENIVIWKHVLWCSVISLWGSSYKKCNHINDFNFSMVLYNNLEIKKWYVMIPKLGWRNVHGC